MSETSSTRRKSWLRSSTALLWFISVFLGVLAAVVHLKFPKAPSHAWFASSSGWEISAFAAFSAMSGFGLASLALVATLAGNERAKEVLETNAGHAMVRRLVTSTWWWMVPATIALVHIFANIVLVECAFIAAVPLALGRAADALLALTVFFRRWTIPISE